MLPRLHCLERAPPEPVFAGMNDSFWHWVMMPCSSLEQSHRASLAFTGDGFGARYTVASPPDSRVSL